MFDTDKLHNKKVVYENKYTTELSVVDEPIQLTKKGDGYTVKDTEILIKVHTAGFNPVDILTKSSIPPILNCVYKHFGLCNDFSGVVVAIGDKAKATLEVGEGDSVCGQTTAAKGPKTLTEYLMLDILMLAGSKKGFAITRPPKTLSMNEAGSFALVYSTAAQMVHLANIKPDSKVLVNGASTSVGKYVVQLLKLNANVKEVVGICSGRSEPVVKELGAHSIIDYKKTNNIVNSVLETCKDKKYDTFLDCCGSEQLLPALSQFMGKKSYVVGIAGGKKSDLAAGETMFSLATFATIKTVVLGKLGLLPYTYVNFLVDSGFGYEEGVKLFEEGKLKPFIDTVFPFDKYQEAYELVVSGKNNGKVAVQVSD